MSTNHSRSLRAMARGSAGRCALLVVLLFLATQAWFYLRSYHQLESQRTIQSSTFLGQHLNATQPTVTVEVAKFEENPKVQPTLVTAKPPMENREKNFLIMVRTSHDDISWVTAYVPVRYTVRAYVADSDDATYHPLINKGKEAMSYLQYIIDNYNDLPDTSTFIHAHQFAIHNNPVFGNDITEMLNNLNPETVYNHGYVNLNCNKNPGCTETFSDRMNKEPVPMLQWFAEAWPLIFPGEPLPEIIAAPCCAQFSVTRDRIRQRSLSFYLNARIWLAETDMANYYSSRLFEYIWHYIFGANAHHCPLEIWCYCELYNKCFPSVDAMHMAKRIGTNTSLSYDDRASAIEAMTRKKE